MQPRESSEIPTETWRRYIVRCFFERFYFAWRNRCWHCLLNPMHPTTKRVQRMIEEEHLKAMERASGQEQRDR